MHPNKHAPSYARLILFALCAAALILIFNLLRPRTASGALEALNGDAGAQCRLEVRPRDPDAPHVCRKPDGGVLEADSPKPGPGGDARPAGDAETILASVSWYSSEESCHHPKDGKCLTASGRPAEEGATVACPRSIALGRWVRIQGHRYRCDDRTADSVQRKFGPTFDIFTGSREEALRLGRKRLEVTIE